MTINTFEGTSLGSSFGRIPAERAAAAIRQAVQERGKARVLAASAASQISFLEALTQAPNMPWEHVELFHLDEYIGIPPTHPASFCLFLQDRLIAKTGIRVVHFLNGMENPEEVIRQVSAAVATAPIDIAFVGIGENGHLAFNDPPADFETDAPYITVQLDHACRMQQVAEGWFKTLEDVPSKAISMSVRQVLKSREILAIVPGPRKAQAIANCLEGEINPMAPASALRLHQNTTVYLDKESAALLQTRSKESHV